MWNYCPILDPLTGKPPYCSGQCLLHHIPDPTVKVVNHAGKPTQFTSHAKAQHFAYDKDHIPWTSGLVDKAYVPEDGMFLSLRQLLTNMIS